MAHGPAAPLSRGIGEILQSGGILCGWQRPSSGREREIAAIEARMDGGGYVAIAGPLGIGKSRLLAELAVRAERRGYAVLVGRGSEYESGVPYGVLAEATLSLPAPEPGALDAERYNVHRAVRVQLERLARQRPLALLLDDLHWADGETVELAAHLMRHPPACAAAARARVPAGAGRRRARRAPSLAPSATGRCVVLDLAPLSGARRRGAGRRSRAAGGARRDPARERRQPVLPRAARPARRRSTSRPPPRTRSTPTCRRPSRPRWRASSRAWPTTSAGCSRAARSPASRSTSGSPRSRRS